MGRKSKKAKREEQWITALVVGVVGLAIVWAVVLKPYLLWIQAKPVPGFLSLVLIFGLFVVGSFFGVNAYRQGRAKQNHVALPAARAAVHGAPTPAMFQVAALGNRSVSTSTTGGQQLITTDKRVSDLAGLIQRFGPFRSSREQGYHKALAGFLQDRGFASIRVEVKTPLGRPDIVVDDEFAIEVKGPTTNAGLKTVAGKAMTYSPSFKHLFIVLFEPHYNPLVFEEIRKGLAVYPNVTLIEKRGA
jgi:hypothetical protein